jgi:xanthine dehydrogenase accessory factor
VSVDLIRELASAVERGQSVVLATVVRTERSVPRRAGTKMLVYGDGRTSGTVGGGEMEARVRTEAAAALSDRRPRMLTYDLLDPAQGDPGVCGGRAEIYLEPHMPAPLLLVVGAGHVGRAVSDLAKWLGFRTVVWDDRPGAIDELVTGSGPDPDATASGPIADVLAQHRPGPDASVVMVTRNVAIDVELLPPILATSAGYVGLMGSRRRWATTRVELAEAGVSEADLARVVSPIGIEIEAETPEEIAVSILAEVVAARRASIGREDRPPADGLAAGDDRSGGDGGPGDRS